MGRIIRAVAGDDFIKICVIEARDIVERARQIHKLSPTATAALGRTLCAVSMMGNMLKEEKGSITARINGGGILGGITSGMPIIFRCAIKPTPSIYKEQESVNITTLESAPLKISGRHDPSIAQRATAVVDAVTAIVIADLLTMRFGTDYLS